MEYKPFTLRFFLAATLNATEIASSWSSHRAGCNKAYGPVGVPCSPKYASCCSSRGSFETSAAAGMEQHSIPVLSTEEVFSKLRADIHSKPYRAMYSSIVNGIITDVAFMLIPIDDHMVHRGHGVFDTAVIAKGYLYELDAHLDRLLRSASMAKISSPFSRQKLRDILVKTVAVSNLKDGFLKYWLSAGPGNFSLSSHGCSSAAFYAVVQECLNESTEPVKVITSSIPMKAPFFATMKNVNYLPNALSVLEAEEQGAFAGIWVDDEGFVAEGPNMNVAFVNAAGELIMPAFSKILTGCTARRTLALAQESLDGVRSPVGNLKGASVRPISAEEGKSASEMMLVGSSLPIVPVVQWDGQQIGNGEPGPVTLALKAFLEKDMLNGPSSIREPVPYDAYA
ncbi:hypothetical protein GOP47_0004377 [Adiantum capillus-veneris]|uniref:Uncharacterized protein n=1 Tax=Adiantum capillus-veneris TaxID=13818 RepID=A0A9D4V7F8_ADICA|nr:hypothetical protein GOP47_0004377 [Adiantum capillus-veneris]